MDSQPVGVPDDGYPTETSRVQAQLEDKIIKLLTKYTTNIDLLRSSHFRYLESLMTTMPHYFSSLDASRAWLSYWILHSLDILNVLPQMSSQIEKFVDFLGSRCQNLSTGGFGGGPGQLSHLAPTYAATMALMAIGSENAYKCFDRLAMYRFLMSVKQKNGSFLMHVDGEVDVRASYCALAVASVLNLMTDELTENCAEFIASCQTYEGGFGGEPNNEAHGGYTFCSVASLALLGKLDVIKKPQYILRWAAQRQMSLEGGFQGRTNKLVDGCYSFWVGGLFPILWEHLESKAHSEAKTEDDSDSKTWRFDEDMLQQYLIRLCQSVHGGLLDKPGKSPDVYHTCYCLSGLSIAQHQPFGERTVFGDESRNTVAPIDPVYNLTKTKLAQALEFFKGLPKPESVIVKKKN